MKRCIFAEVGTLVLLMLFLSHPTLALEVTITSQMPDTAWVYLGAGVHDVQPVGGGWSPWNVTSCTDPAGCPQTCTTTFTGWMGRYMVTSPDLVSVSVDGVPLTPVTSIPPCVGQRMSYFVQSSGGGTHYLAHNGLVFPDAAGALANALTSVFTLGSPGMVGFVLTNQAYGDNRGTMTLRIDGTVPVGSKSWGITKALYR